MVSRAGQLEHIRVFLLRHDAAAGTHHIRQSHEAELLAVVEHKIRRQAVEGRGDLNERMHELHFELSARQLCRRHVELETAEARSPSHLFARKRQHWHAYPAAVPAGEILTAWAACRSVSRSSRRSSA